MTEWFAFAALVCFAAIMVFVGVRSSKKAGTLDNFLLGGRNVGAWLSAFSYGTAYFSAVIFIGYAGTHGWNIGIGALWIGIGNALLGTALAWKLLANRTRAMTRALNVRTMPQFFEARYGDAGMRRYASVIIFIFLVPYASSVYKGLGSLFGSIFPNISDVFWGLSPDVICMFFVAVLTAVYLVLGGYMASSTVDFIQGIVMIFGVVAMIFGLLANPNVGGIGNLFSELKSVEGTDGSLMDIFGGGHWKFLLTNIALTSFGTWGLPQMIHKFYAIKGKEQVKRATVISTLFALIIGCGAYFIGTMGRFFVAANADGSPVTGFDGVVPAMLKSAFGSSMAGNLLLSVILLCVLSASMSTLSSLVLTSSSAVTLDLIPYFRRKPEKQLFWTRMFCFLFVLVSFLFATFKISIIVSLMSFSWGVISGCFLGPYLWGLHSKKVTKAGAWSGLLAGLLVVFVMTVYAMITSDAIGFGARFSVAAGNAPLYGVVAMAVSVVIVPIVSRFTKPLDSALVDRAFVSEEA